MENILRSGRNLQFGPRESSRESTIANGSILAIWTRLRSSIPGALTQPKLQVSTRSQYTPFRILKSLGMLVLSGISPIFALTPSPLCQNIQAVIFDCDGVLVDTEYLKFLSWEKALACKGVEFTIEDYMPLVGHSSKSNLQKIRQQKGIEIDGEVIDLRHAEYRILQAQGVPPLPQMIEFARGLSRERQRLGIKLGLASSAPTEEIMNNLKQIGLDEAFDLIISGSDDLDAYVDGEGKNKPKPYIYIEAAKRLDVSPSHCLVFEDTTAGIEAAFGAGMSAVAVPNQYTLNQDFSKAVRVIHSYEELSFKEMASFTFSAS